MNRRQALKCVAGGLFATRTLAAQQPAFRSRFARGNNLGVLDVGGSNVLCFRMPTSAFILVDVGASKNKERVLEAIKTVGGSAKVQIVFNTHYHADQTGNNEVFAADGAKIIAHEHTRQWMRTDHWVPDQDRYERARLQAAWPTETFRTTGSLKSGNQTIEYGHLPLAHTDGDIYVFLREVNVLAVGDVASPLLDPALDWFTGAWIGGRLDAMDAILKLSDDQTKIVPASGPVMSRAEFKEERDMMEEVRSRVWKHILQGESPKEMLDAGVLNGLLRTWKDPYKFLYDAAKGMFAHHNKLDTSIQ